MKRIISNIFLSALAVMALASCNNPSKMAEKADQMIIKCNPEVLEVVAGEINADVTVTFPAEWFSKKAVLEVTPVIVYDGGEVAGKPFVYQGEKISDNYKNVDWKSGATVSEKVNFKYVKGMEKSQLVARAVVKSGSKSYPFPGDIKVADGANTTYMMIDKSGAYELCADKYQDVIPETEEAQILYLINSSEVRNSQINSKDVKDFTAALKALEKDSRREVKGTEIVAYASPDGGEELNDKLSSNREKSAEKAFKHITKKVNAGGVETRSIGEDWEGFQELVQASDIEDKDLIIRVLSMYSDPNVREREIKNMSSVYQSLAKNVLPQLRRARFITNVEYTNYTADELKDLVENNIDVLDEEALLRVATLVNDDAKLAVYDQAIKKYDSQRAKHNAACVCLDKKDLAGAKKYIASANECDCIKNLKGVVALREGNEAEAAKYFDAAGNKDNQAVMAVLNGEYAKAASLLDGKTGYNKAVVDILNDNLGSVNGDLGDCKCAKSAYLKAIVAARQGNASEAKSKIAEASKKECLAKRARNDVEFAKVK